MSTMLVSVPVTIADLREGDRVCGRPGAESDLTWCATIVGAADQGGGRFTLLLRADAVVADLADGAPVPPAAFSRITMDGRSRAHRICPAGERHDHGCGCVSEYRGGWIGWAHVVACTDHPMSPDAVDLVPTR